METINLNGIEYVKKECLEELKDEMSKEYIKKEDIDESYIKREDLRTSYVSKEEVKEFKAAMREGIANLMKLTGVKSPTFEAPKVVIEEKPELPKRKLNRHKPFGGSVTPRSRDNRVFTPSNTSSRILNITGVKDGYFVRESGRKTKFSVDDVRFLRNNVNNRTTFKDVRMYARRLKLSPEMTRTIIYNIQNHTFDRYL